MPRRSRKAASKKERCLNQFSTKCDFTVYEYAHSANTAKSVQSSSATEVHSSRLKKAVSNAWRAEVKELCGQSVLHCRHDIVADCLDDDIDDATDHIIDPGFDSADNNFSIPVSVSATSQDTTMSLPSQSQLDPVIYPLDLWFLVGDHVSPEDVSVFARICHFTHIVVHSARFWFQLYRRFCHPLSNLLPLSLQPERVLRHTHGLRTRVVRALYIVYAPLSSRVVHNAVAGSSSCGGSAAADPQSLVGLRCVLAWYEHLPKCQWRFYFRFQRGSGGGCSKNSCPLVPSSSTDPLLAPANVSHNPDDRSVVLVASTPHFLALPVVMGQVLVAASISGAIFTQCLRLVFCSEYVHASRANIAGATITAIDPVLSVHVVHWWNPSFPHRH